MNYVINCSCGESKIVNIGDLNEFKRKITNKKCSNCGILLSGIIHKKINGELTLIPFRKYSSIGNHYNTKLDKLLINTNNNQEWILTSKIHGTHFAISIFFDGQEMVVDYGKRTMYLSENINFFEHKNVVKDYQNVINTIADFYKNKHKHIVLECEMFGDGIQKEIRYSKHKQIVFYDLFLDGELISPKKTKELFNELGLSEYYIKDYGVKTLKEALEFDVENAKSLYGSDMIEGIVIKPYDLKFNGANTYYIKKKSIKFNDKSGVNKKNSNKKVKFNNPLIPIYSAYITTHRINSIISREGGVKSHQEISKFITIIHSDATKDFISELDGKYEINCDLVIDADGNEIDIKDIQKHSNAKIALEIKTILKK